MHVNISVVEETHVGTEVGESSRNRARCQHSHETEKGLQRETCTSTNHSLGVYRQITLHQGTVSGHFSGIRMPKGIDRFKTPNDFTSHTRQGYAVVLTTTVGCRE